MKTCSVCGESKPPDDFYAVGAQCKACKRASARARYAADPEPKLARNREWELANIDQVRAAERARYARQPDKHAEKRRVEIASGRHAARVRSWRARNKQHANAWSRAWQAKNREQLREDARARYAADRERFAAAARRWRAENREHIRAYWRARHAANPEARRDIGHRRRARERGTAIGPIDYAALWEEQKGHCGICGDQIDAELSWPHPESKSQDHVVPLAQGGTHTQDNLQWVHLVCNLIKGDRLPEH